MLTQPDLFGVLDADQRRRHYDALTCLAVAHPRALELLIGIRPPDRGACRASAGDGWAYAVTRQHFRFQPRDTWHGWDHAPADAITWGDLDTLLEPHRRVLDGLRAWSTSLTAIDAWKDRYRPKELCGEPDWHPSYYEADHARDGWPARLDAWTTAIDLCLTIRRDL